jgi:hypothetical protein
MYWVSVDFNPSGQLTFHDVSGEGYGAPAPTTPSSCNATVSAYPLTLTPLYANASDQANCAKPTGYVIYQQGQYCSAYGGCTTTCNPAYQYGSGVNASALAAYCPNGSF